MGAFNNFCLPEGTLRAATDPPYVSCRLLCKGLDIRLQCSYMLQKHVYKCVHADVYAAAYVQVPRLGDLVLDLLHTNEAWLLQVVTDTNAELIVEGHTTEASALTMELLHRGAIKELAVVVTAMVQSGRSRLLPAERCVVL